MFSAHKPQMINNLRPIHQIIPKVFIVISKILCKVLINHHIMPRKRNGNHLHQHHDHHQRHHHYHQNRLHQIEGLGHHGHRPRKGVVAGWRRRLQQLPWVRESESHPHHLPIKQTHTHTTNTNTNTKKHTQTHAENMIQRFTHHAHIKHITNVSTNTRKHYKHNASLPPNCQRWIALKILFFSSNFSLLKDVQCQV